MEKFFVKLSTFSTFLVLITLFDVMFHVKQKGEKQALYFLRIEKTRKNQENKREKIIKNTFKNNLTKNNAKN